MNCEGYREINNKIHKSIRKIFREYDAKVRYISKYELFWDLSSNLLQTFYLKKYQSKKFFCN